MSLAHSHSLYYTILLPICYYYYFYFSHEDLQVCLALHPELRPERPKSARAMRSPSPGRGNDSDGHRARSASPARSSSPERERVGGLVRCRVCGRTFTLDRVETHESICIKLSWNQSKINKGATYFYYYY